LLHIHNGSDNKWCCHCRCYQVCSDKQGDLPMSTKEDNDKESKESDHNDNQELEE
jgi:hypothetical protein